LETPNQPPFPWQRLLLIVTSIIVLNLFLNWLFPESRIFLAIACGVVTFFATIVATWFGMWIGRYDGSILSGVQPILAIAAAIVSLYGGWNSTAKINGGYAVIVSVIGLFMRLKR
jgi:hypothetical protein